MEEGFTLLFQDVIGTLPNTWVRERQYWISENGSDMTSALGIVRKWIFFLTQKTFLLKYATHGV